MPVQCLHGYLGKQGDARCFNRHGRSTGQRADGVALPAGVRPVIAVCGGAMATGGAPACFLIQDSPIARCATLRAPDHQVLNARRATRGGVTPTAASGKPVRMPQTTDHGILWARLRHCVTT